MKKVKIESKKKSESLIELKTEPSQNNQKIQVIQKFLQRYEISD